MTPPVVIIYLHIDVFPRLCDVFLKEFLRLVNAGTDPKDEDDFANAMWSCLTQGRSSQGSGTAVTEEQLFSVARDMASKIDSRVYQITATFFVSMITAAGAFFVGASAGTTPSSEKDAASASSKLHPDTPTVAGWRAAETASARSSPLGSSLPRTIRQAEPV